MKIEEVFTSMPIIETNRIILRKIAQNDAAHLFEYSSSQEVTKYISYTHQRIEDAKRYIDAKEEKYQLGQCMIWGIECKEDNKFIGTCGFTHWSTEDGSAEIAYTLSQDYWGKGIGTELVNELFKFGFENMNLNRIEARCWIENENSAKLMERCNMKFEGTLREQIYSKEEYRDVHMYSILRKEYLA